MIGVRLIAAWGALALGAAAFAQPPAAPSANVPLNSVVALPATFRVAIEMPLLITVPPPPPWSASEATVWLRPPKSRVAPSATRKWVSAGSTFVSDKPSIHFRSR